MKKKIGIMGGTFDPIHYGHLVLAEQVRTEYKLDSVCFIPAGSPPHKQDSGVTSSDERFYMTLLATITNEHFSVSSIEIDSDEISYTIKTIKALKKEFGEETELCFITGADAIYDIETWNSYEELLRITRFIAATRPGIDLERLNEKIIDLNKKYGADIDLIKVPALAISSTDIRNRVMAGKSIRYLIPDAVEDYIYKRDLYKRGKTVG